MGEHSGKWGSHEISAQGQEMFPATPYVDYSRSRIRRFLGRRRVTIFRRILGLGLRIPKIPKLVPDLFGPSGASAGLAQVIFGLLDVSGIISEEHQKFRHFSTILFYFSLCHDWRISLLMQNDQKWPKIIILGNFQTFFKKWRFFSKNRNISTFRCEKTQLYMMPEHAGGTLYTLFCVFSLGISWQKIWQDISKKARNIMKILKI